MRERATFSAVGSLTHMTAASSNNANSGSISVPQAGPPPRMAKTVSSADAAALRKARSSSTTTDLTDFDILSDNEVQEAVQHRPVRVTDDIVCFGTLEKVTPQEKSGSRTRLVSNAVKNMAARFGARKRFFLLLKVGVV